MEQVSPLELALRPALVDGRWQVPGHFNFARDVVEALADDPKRTAVTILGKDGVIEPRTFFEIAEGAAGRAAALREHGVHPKDRVIVMADTSMHWLELVLGAWKAGAVAVPVRPSLTAPELEALHASTGASLIFAEPECSDAIEAMSFAPDVVYVEEQARKRSGGALEVGPTHDTSSRDLALILTTSGTEGRRKEIGHTHGAVFATRAQAEQWLDAGRGDVVWCTAEPDSSLAIWFTLAGPWSRGAEAVIHQGEFDPQERLEHVYRIGPTILCQSAGEFRALAEHDKLARFRPPRLRRLVSTGDVLEPEVVEIFRESWGLTIHNGYGQAETNIVAGDGGDDDPKGAGALGRAFAGFDVVVVDDQGNELPSGIEGDLAVRGNPPTLFAGYWEAPEETKSAFRGDLYLTGDVAVADEEGFLTYVARAEDVITSSGRTFGPYGIEHVLRSHDAVAACAVVGVRDLQRGGHFVRAVVVLAPGAEESEQLEAQLRHFLAEVLPEQQVPREIVFVEELPIVRGRLSRSALRGLPLPGKPLWKMPPTSEPELAEEAPAPSQTASVAHAAAAAPVVAPEPEPVVVPQPEPVAEVVVEPERVVVPKPVAEAVPEPEPVAEVAVEPEPVVVPEPEPVVAPEPEPVAEVAVEPEPVVVPEPEPVVVPEPEPVAEVVVEPVAAQPESDRRPELRIVGVPGTPPASEEPAAEAPIEAEPDDLVPPEAEAGQAVPPPVLQEPEEEPEPDLGPLPDYIIDPDRPPPPKAEPKREPASAAPPPTDRPPGAGDESSAAAAGLYFPPVTSFPLPREEDGEADHEETPRAPRRRAAPEKPKSKSKRSQEDPGDDASGASWMAGLSNRLSAYSLGEEGEKSTDAPSDDEDAPASEQAS